MDSYSSENCQSFSLEQSSFTDDIVSKNCSADASGTSGYASRSSSIRAFSSAVGSKGNSLCGRKKKKKKISTIFNAQFLTHFISHFVKSGHILCICHIQYTIYHTVYINHTIYHYHISYLEHFLFQD